MGKLRAAVVGCRGMGSSHAAHMAKLPQYEFVAACDLVSDLGQQVVDKCGGKVYTDYAKMLAEAKPDVVAIATNNVSHAPLAIQAAAAGVKGVYCEKPMAENYGMAKAMVEACKKAGVKLAVNHQRRCYPVFRKMRQIIESGEIGNVHLIVCSNAGDMLSDGTHFVDTARHLAGDVDVKWVLGQVYRKQSNPAEPRAMGFQASGGWRYGHPVETGAMGVFEFVNGIRAEVHSGEMMMAGKWYQYYEVLGSKGRLVRNMDQADPPLVIQDEKGGFRAVPIETTGDAAHRDSMDWIFTQFAEMITGGADHPLSGDNALKDQEIVMAIYESARLRERITLPLKQNWCPLDLMIERGELPR